MVWWRRLAQDHISRAESKRLRAYEKLNNTNGDAVIIMAVASTILCLQARMRISPGLRWLAIHGGCSAHTNTHTESLWWDGVVCNVASVRCLCCVSTSSDFIENCNALHGLHIIVGAYFVDQFSVERNIRKSICVLAS